jgi:hypothetical protein
MLVHKTRKKGTFFGMGDVARTSIRIWKKGMLFNPELVIRV